MPIFRECQRCTACCQWPGDVRVGDSEIASIAQHLALSEADFIERFTRLRLDRQGLSLIDKPGGECIFFDGRRCTIQSVKPQQCRDFPNLWNFPGFENICRSKTIPVDTETYVKLVSVATGRSEDFVRQHPSAKAAD
jgi:Fe-S-cluster containining protein